MSVWKSAEKLLIFASLISPPKIILFEKWYQSIRQFVSSPAEIPWSSSKILCCTSYFQFSSRCFTWWWNKLHAFHAWYITSKSSVLPLSDYQITVTFFLLLLFLLQLKCAKKVVSNSPGLVDFAIGLVNSIINLPNGQVNFFEEFKLQKNCEINLLIKTVFGLVEMIFGLVNVSLNLPEWQAVKMTFFAPWTVVLCLSCPSQ